MRFAYHSHRDILDDWPDRPEKAAPARARRSLIFHECTRSAPRLCTVPRVAERREEKKSSRLHLDPVQRSGSGGARAAILHYVATMIMNFERSAARVDGFARIITT